MKLHEFKFTVDCDDRILDANGNRCYICDRRGYYVMSGYFNSTIYSFIKDCEIIKVEKDEESFSYAVNEVHIDCNGWDIDRKVREVERKKRIEEEVEKANKYLASPFAKQWLKKMQYTVKEDEYGNKFLVNGRETYFCGVVGEDDFSPEDFDKDHSEYSFENANKYIHD